MEEEVRCGLAWLTRRYEAWICVFRAMLKAPFWVHGPMLSRRLDKMMTGLEGMNDDDETGEVVLVLLFVAFCPALA